MQWTRAEVKLHGKNNYFNNFWPVFLMTLLFTIAETFMSGIGNSLQSFSSSGFRSYTPNASYGGAIIAASFAVLIAALLAVLIIYAYYFFFVYPVQIGFNRWMLDNGKQVKPFDFASYFAYFKNGRYLKVVGAMAWYFLWVFLWSMLFAVPGIIKSYEYYFVPYILADNPDIGHNNALKLSSRMTNNQKWNLFVFDLSFLGWLLLGLLCCCVGALFVHPYVYSSRARLYETFKCQAVAMGMASAGEFGNTL